MKLRHVFKLLVAASIVFMVFHRTAAAEAGEETLGGRDEIPSWAHVSKEQRDEARKLGLPVAFTNSLSMRFVLIPPGAFQMGSGESAEEVRANCIGVKARPDWAEDEHPRRHVRLTRPFYISICEVTEQEFKAVEQSMGALSDEKQARRRKPPEMPAEVSWDEATSICEQLSTLEERTYRLPTEAEWEYACRAGTTTPFYFGETIGPDDARYDWRRAYGPTGKTVQDAAHTAGAAVVGSFPPNAWGLHDMHGNVWEWCSDWYGEYQEENTTDAEGPSSGTERVVRGGAWHHSPALCRSANRGSYMPEYRDYIGLRVVLEAQSVAAE